MTTGTEPTLPPMGGLAIMACRLAWERTYPCSPYQHWFPFGRETLQWGATGAYYTIIDRIARGEKP